MPSFLQRAPSSAIDVGLRVRLGQHEVAAVSRDRGKVAGGGRMAVHMPETMMRQGPLPARRPRSAAVTWRLGGASAYGSRT